MTSTSPAAGTVTPIIRLTMVVLPHPEGPSRQRMLPRSTRRFTRSSTVRLPSAKGVFLPNL